MSHPRAIDAAIMRGGTSRGVVLNLEAAPTAGPVRDDLARTLIGPTVASGLGGGTAITNKVVLVGPSQSDEAELDYIVGNVSPDGQTVDWSGTCGNMTAAVVPFAHAVGLLTRWPDTGRWLLRNLATGGLVAAALLDLDRATPEEGGEMRLSTTFLSPGGAVLYETLPTGRPAETIEIDGESFDMSLVDVTHPYLLLDYEQVVGERRLDEPETLARIERIRGSVCVALGLCSLPDEATVALAAVPRVVLVHLATMREEGVSITAISMGEPISSVPVTAALCVAAARQIAGTIIGTPGSTGGAAFRVSGPSGSVSASAVIDGEGRLVSAEVERTARLLMRGRLWI